MNFISTHLWIVEVLLIFYTLGRGEKTRAEEVIEKFYWTPKNDAQDVQLEFSVIGTKVPWDMAKAVCSSRESRGKSDTYSLDPEDTSNYGNSSRTRENVKATPESRLAILEEDETKTWLSRMLSESDYRYDGLWVGGHRTSASGNWTWTGSADTEDIAIPPSPILANYPEWYKPDEPSNVEKNCLVFDRIGHDLPILVPSDCQLLKPFICSRVVRKRTPGRIAEGIAVYADGFRYTVYSVEDDEEEADKFEETSAVRKLNGGGVKWRDARMECRKRGQYLATVLSNAAATGIASIMLKNRPSMESAWLGGWSPDGTDWTWSPTGFVLPPTKSSTTQYPPWLSGHPVSSSKLNEYYPRRGRCLILDRHLCPDHISPVFLDLDCEKKRPFVCQDALPEHIGIGNREARPVNRSIAVSEKLLEISADRMTWNEGQIHCANNFGRIASVLDSKTLSAILNKMTDLYLDHIWVGGRTERTSEGWRWFDETGKALSRKGIGVGSSWCLGDDESSWPKAEAETCLNLDREGHGLPLFYGLRCDSAKQHVLCSIDHGSRSLSDSKISEPKMQEAKINEKDSGKFAFSGRRSLGPELKIHRTPDEREEIRSEITQPVPPQNNNRSFGFNEEDSRTSNRFSEDYEKRPANETETRIMANNTLPQTGIRVSELDEDTKKLLAASGYDITDRDLILGLEVELVDLAENSTIIDLKKKGRISITGLSSILAERIRDLASDKRSAILFVLDDSLSILNAWLAEELKFIAIVLRNFFPLSPEHPMGLLTFSHSSRLSLAINQTDDCFVISYLGQIFEKRGSHRDAKGNKRESTQGSIDLLRAAVSAVDNVRNSGLNRVAIMFIADGEHALASEDNDDRARESLIEKLKNLRNSGHEAFALFVGDGLQVPGRSTGIHELFGDSPNGKRNLYIVKSFAQLGKLVSHINSTTSRVNNDSQCEEPQWNVPEEDSVSTQHLLRKT